MIYPLPEIYPQPTPMGEKLKEGFDTLNFSHLSPTLITSLYER